MPQSDSEKAISAKIVQVFGEIAQKCYSNDMDWTVSWDAWNQTLTMKFYTNEIEYYHERLKTKMRKGSDYEFTVRPDQGEYDIVETPDGTSEGETIQQGNMLELEPSTDQVYQQILRDIVMSEGDTR